MSEYTYKVSAAGRVNIIGEHIDYCGGKVFPAALSLKNTVYVRPNGTNFINIKWTDISVQVSLDIDHLERYTTLKYGNYPAGSALMWKRAGHKLVGCDMLQDCSVPFGSGLSSSAAIEVSTIAALAAVAGEKIDNVEIALLAQKAEREYIGMNCGIMDQYASACGKKGQAMLLDCKTVTCEYYPVELGDYSLVITNCNKPHNLVESKYNERRSEAEQALKVIQEYEDVSCLADVTPAMFEKYREHFHGKIFSRTKHIVEECERVRLAAIAMQEGDMKKLGELLNASHNSLRYLYEVTGRELDTLVTVARTHPACIGSRMTGGGFGGCTISLVKTSEVEDFKEKLIEGYKKEIGYAPSCYEASIEDGIIVETL